MPEYNMPGRCEAFTDLDGFTRGYIECLFFTSVEIGTTRETHDPETQSSLPGDVGFQDLAPETLQSIMDDCKSFQEVHSALLAKAYQCGDYNEERAGHDFWLTRNGHGAGFWDRSELGDLGQDLADVCGWESRLSEHPFPEVDAYLGDDGKIYV